MKMHKILIILLCVSFILTAFAGCKSNDETKPNDDTNVSVNTGENSTQPTTKPNGETDVGGEDTESDEMITVTLPDGSTIEVPKDAIIEGEQGEQGNENGDISIIIPPKEEEEHNMEYYLDLANRDKQNNWLYSGQIKLYKTTYKTVPTFKELMLQYKEMESEKDVTIGPYSGTYTRFNMLPDNIYLEMMNMTDKTIRFEDAKITRIIIELDKNAKLNDIIGETLKEVDATMTFIDAVIDIFGNPNTSTQIDENTVELRYVYENVSITLEYNIATNEGDMYIEYK